MPTTWVGWSTVGRRGWESRLSGADLVVRDILNHLFTIRGERVMRPEWGSGLLSSFMAPDDNDLRRMLGEDIMAVLRADPRVEPGDVRVSGPPGELLIEVSFRIRGFAEVQTLRLTVEDDRLVPAS